MIPSNTIEASLISDIKRCITDYQLRINEPIVVGLSGGKDSTLLVFLLSKMGFEVIPVIVDLGYKSFDARSIAAFMSSNGFHPHIVSAKDSDRITHLSSINRARIQFNMNFLASPGDVTPCGACSQTKRSLLVSEAMRCSSRWIALGHHRDDFLATALKDYFISEYYAKIGAYDADLFRQFVQNTDVDLFRLGSLVEQQLAATMAIRLRLPDGIELIRPMVYISEADIVKFIETSNIRTFGSGCSHEMFHDHSIIPVTKREIVHADLQRRLRQTPALGDEVLSIVLKSLNEQGRLRFNPRAARDHNLPGFEKVRSGKDGL